MATATHAPNKGDLAALEKASRVISVCLCINYKPLGADLETLGMPKTKATRLFVYADTCRQKKILCTGLGTCLRLCNLLLSAQARGLSSKGLGPKGLLQLRWFACHPRTQVEPRFRRRANSGNAALE